MSSFGSEQRPRQFRLSVNAALSGLLILFFLTAPWTLPLFANAFWVSITAEIMILSLLAASVNFLFGYTGLLSFGQALYFGFGTGLTAGNRRVEKSDAVVTCSRR